MKFLTIAEAAGAADVHPGTIKKYVREGKLKRVEVRNPLTGKTSLKLRRSDVEAIEFRHINRGNRVIDRVRRGKAA